MSKLKVLLELVEEAWPFSVTEVLCRRLYIVLTITLSNIHLQICLIVSSGTFCWRCVDPPLPICSSIFRRDQCHCLLTLSALKTHCVSTYWPSSTKIHTSLIYFRNRPVEGEELMNTVPRFSERFAVYIYTKTNSFGSGSLNFFEHYHWLLKNQCKACCQKILLEIWETVWGYKIRSKYRRKNSVGIFSASHIDLTFPNSLFPLISLK